MWQKFIEFIRKLFSNNKQLTSSFLLSDEEVERRLEQQENNLKLLHETIGSNPLDQIDWIIENGYDEYYEKYKSYQDGSIGTKEEVEFDVGDMARDVGSHEHTIKESMNIGFIKGALEDKLKDRIDILSLDNSLRAKNEREKLGFALHKNSNKRASLEEIYQQVKRELELYNIEFNTDNKNILSEILKTSIKHFNTCETVLELDDDQTCFREVLENKEIVILVKWMAYFYTDNLIKMNERLSIFLNAKDYRLVSSSSDSNMQKASEKIEREVIALQLRYSLEMHLKSHAVS